MFSYKKVLENKMKKSIKEATICFTILGLATQCFGNFLPYFKESYGLNYNQSGLLLSAHSIGISVATLLAGIIPFFIGRKKTVVLFGLGVIVGYIIFNLPATSFIVLILAFFIIGLGRGSDSNFTNTLCSLVPKEEITNTLNTAHAGYAIGAVISPIILIVLTILFGRIGFNITMLILLILVVVRQLIYMRMEVPEINKNDFETANKKKIDLNFLKNEKFILGLFIELLYVSSEFGILTWLVTYFKETGILPDNFSHIVNAIIWGAMFFGRIICIKFASKISNEKILLFDAISMTVCYLIIMRATNAYVVLFMLFLLGISMATVYTASLSYATYDTPGNDFENAFVVFVSTAGSSISPAIIGFVADRCGLKSGMWVVAVLVTLFLILTIISFKKYLKGATNK